MGVRAGLSGRHPGWTFLGGFQGVFFHLSWGAMFLVGSFFLISCGGLLSSHEVLYASSMGYIICVHIYACDSVAMLAQSFGCELCQNLLSLSTQFCRAGM